MHFTLEQNVKLESVLSILEELLVVLDLLESLHSVVGQLDLQNGDDGLEVFMVVDQEYLYLFNRDVQVDGMGGGFLGRCLFGHFWFGLFALDFFQETLEQEYLGWLHDEYLVVLERELEPELSGLLTSL